MPRLPGKPSGPWQRRLAGERFEKKPRRHRRKMNRSASSRAQHHSAGIGCCTPSTSNCRAPPPCRGRRSILLRHRAPSDEFAHRAFELYIRNLMHRYLHTNKMILAFAIAANATLKPYVSALLPGRRPDPQPAGDAAQRGAKRCRQHHGAQCAVELCR